MKKQIFYRLALLAVAAAVYGLLLGWVAARLALPLSWLCAGGAALLALLLGLASAVSSWIARRVLRPIEEFSQDPDQERGIYPELAPIFQKIREERQSLRQETRNVTEDRDAVRIIAGNMQKELERQREDFAANAAHLREPLTVISGLGEKISAGEVVGEKARQLAGEIARESSRMLALLDDMVRLSRLDGAKPGDMTRVSLTAVCRETLTSLSLMAHRKGVSLKLTGPEVWTRGSSELLGELMTALCENAIQYNHEEGSVLVETGSGPDDGTVWVSVRDTGIGIPDGSFQRIFERFYQVDSHRSRQTGGTGLGLSIASRLAEFHQGSIALQSTPGEGSVFTVTLPAWQEAAQKAPAPALG